MLAGCGYGLVGNANNLLAPNLEKVSAVMRQSALRPLNCGKFFDSLSHRAAADLAYPPAFGR